MRRSSYHRLHGAIRDLTFIPVSGGARQRRRSAAEMPSASPHDSRKVPERLKLAWRPSVRTSAVVRPPLRPPRRMPLRFEELYGGRLLGRRVVDRGRRQNVRRRDAGLLGRRDGDRFSKSCAVWATCSEVPESHSTAIVRRSERTMDRCVPLHAMKSGSDSCSEILEPNSTAMVLRSVLRTIDYCATPPVVEFNTYKHNNNIFIHDVCMYA